MRNDSTSILPTARASRPSSAAHAPSASLAEARGLAVLSGPRPACTDSVIGTPFLPKPIIGQGCDTSLSPPGGRAA